MNFRNRAVMAGGAPTLAGRDGLPIKPASIPGSGKRRMSLQAKDCAPPARTERLRTSALEGFCRTSFTNHLRLFLRTQKKPPRRAACAKPELLLIISDGGRS